MISPRNVTEFSYRYGDPTDAHIFLSFDVMEGRTRSQDVAEILRELTANNMRGMDLSDDELAKSHARYLVGGRADAPKERLYQFTFPERPGALERFLHQLPKAINVSLFHYRNFGADIGKVLVGLQVPLGMENELERFLAELNYPWREETASAVYKAFLTGS